MSEHFKPINFCKIQNIVQSYWVKGNKAKQSTKKNYEKQILRKAFVPFAYIFYKMTISNVFFFVFVLHFFTFVVMWRIWFCIFIYFNNFNSLFDKMEFNLINWQFKSLLLLMTWKIIILENEWMNPWICNMLHQRKNKIDFQ